jgi:glycine/D-amino acid oxidase-like deaminating enzyme
LSAVLNRSTGLDADIAILGTGTIGTASAIYLRDSGYRVLTIDPNEPGVGTASGSGGYLHDGEIFSVAEPALIKNLPRMMVEQDGPLVVRSSSFPNLFGWGVRFISVARSWAIRRTIAGQASLNRLAIDAMLDLARRVSASLYLSRCGGLTVFRERETLANLERTIPILQSEGIDARLLDHDELLTIEPALSTCLGAVYFSTAAHCTDPHAFGSLLAAELMRTRVHRPLHNGTPALSFRAVSKPYLDKLEWR